MVRTILPVSGLRVQGETMRLFYRPKGNGSRDIRVVSGQFLVSLCDVWAQRGNEILHRVADKHPELYRATLRAGVPLVYRVGARKLISRLASAGQWVRRAVGAVLLLSVPSRAASSWRGLLASDDSSTRWHVRFAREDDDRGSRFGDLAAFLKLDNNSPGRSWQPGLRVCLFDQLETFFSVNNQFAQNGDDARLVSNPESSSQSSDPMTQPNFLFLKLHDTPPIRWPPSMAGIIALVQRLW